MIPRGRRRMMAAWIAGGLVTLAVAACGTAGNDAEISRVITAAFTTEDERLYCEELISSDLVIEDFGNTEGCLEDAIPASEDSVRVDEVIVSDIEVNGDNATADVEVIADTEEVGGALLALVREDGRWRISEVLGSGEEVTGGLFDAFTDQSGTRVGDQLDEAEELEEQLEVEPGNAELLTRLIRARYTAGNALYEFDDAGQQQLTLEAREQFELAVDTWDRYLEAEPRRIDPNVAQLVANAYFALAQGATDGNMARANSAAAAEAQQYFAEARPSLGSLSSLALYHYFGNDFESGDWAAEQAVAQADEGSESRQVQQEMQVYREQAREFQDELDAFNEMSPEEGSSLQSPSFGG